MGIKNPADELIILPKEVLSNLKNASADELKTLIYYFAESEASASDAARELGMTKAQVESACAFWRGAGIFVESVEKKKHIAADTSVYRNYDAATLSNAVEHNSDFSMVCKIASDKLEKMLTKNDISALFYLYDFVRIPAPIICGVIEFCCANGKKSIQYIFKKATALYEDGIDSYEKFELFLARVASVNSNIGRLRKLCGMGERALTAKEQKLFDCWFGEWGFPYETVELAYEKAVDATGKLSTNYMNGILRRWHEEGFVTVEDVQNGDKGAGAGSNVSFEGDEFIEAALSRGFDD